MIGPRDVASMEGRCGRTRVHFNASLQRVVDIITTRSYYCKSFIGRSGNA